MTFEEIKSKVEKLKTQRDQALGAIKNIEDGWESKYGTRDVKALTNRLHDMELERSELKDDFDKKLAAAEAILEGK